LDRLKYKQQYNEVPIDEYTERQIVDLSTIMDSLEEENRDKLLKNVYICCPVKIVFLLTLYYYEEQSLDEISKILV
jgi:RNA polymerase sigma-70 factor (ECF subfamily)